MSWGCISIREGGRSSCHSGDLERRPRRGGEGDHAARQRHFVTALRHGFFEQGRSIRLIARIPSKVLTCTCGWWTQRPPLRSKCNASLSICATAGEEPEVELALV
jgi:hypothetical protein